VTCNDCNIGPRKRQLLDAAVEYLLEHGVANLSLRPLAEALDTSPRILMFHFKSKDGLLQDVLDEVQSHIQKSFAAMAKRHVASDEPALIVRFWKWASSAKNLPYLRLAYEVQVVAASNPEMYARYLKRISKDWQTLTFAALSETNRDDSIVTLCIAVFDGLFLELISSGDRARLTRALERFVEMANR
jgi:AcrR family transcriptional regulator